MSWHWVLVTFFAGGLGGYILCDVIQTENTINYVIKKLKAKKGGSIDVDAEAVLSNEDKRQQKKEERKQRRESRKNKK
jgi:hypothetical protein